jgi:toxin FitB
MILLDTNVVSEPLRRSGDPAVIAWIDAQNFETLYLAAISLAELRFGVAAMASGRRKDTLDRNLERRIVPLFAGRILPFDTAASQTYAEIMARARSEGKAIGKADGYIAATAAANGLIVATRDTSPFEAARVTVINPWKMR